MNLLQSLNFLHLITVGGAVLFFFLFTRNLFKFIFRMENEGTHKKRFKELNYDGTRIGQSANDETKEFLNTFTEPVIRYLLPYVKMKSNEEIQYDLAFAGWSKMMDAEQYKALNIILKGVGVLVFALLAKMALPIALIWGVGLFFGMGFFLNNSVKNKKEHMFSGFPEFIRLVQGYLAAEMPLTNAIENTIEFVGDDWKPYLKDFVINARTRSVSDALDTMRNDIDIFEVKELLSLIRLSIEQGIDVQEAFESQNSKVREMQLSVMMSKIEKRKMMAVILQGPLLLTIMVAMALPTMEQMVGIGG